MKNKSWDALPLGCFSSLPNLPALAGSGSVLLPFFSMGIWNDFVMRCSIPSLFILCVLVIKNVINTGVEKFYRNLLIGCLALNMVGGINVLYLAVKDSRGQVEHRYKVDSEEFLKSDYGWQYINWDEENSIIRPILK